MRAMTEAKTLPPVPLSADSYRYALPTASSGKARNGRVSAGKCATVMSQTPPDCSDVQRRTIYRGTSDIERRGDGPTPGDR
jgi:hypothetical protein